MSDNEAYTGHEDIRDERRKYVRVGPSSNIEVHIQGTEVAHIIGLGSGGTGMRVITDKPLQLDQPLNISLDLKRDIPPLAIRGRVAWRNEEDFGYCKRYFSGIEFTGTEETKINIIHDFIQNHL